MENRRSARRWHTAQYSKGGKKCTSKFFGVYNRPSDEFIGYLVDISSEGMMILSKKAFPEGDTLKLRIELPVEIKGSDQLIVEAKCVWCERDTNPEFNRLGFSFTYTFPHHAEVIGLLFRDSDESENEKPEEVPSRAN